MVAGVARDGQIREAEFEVTHGPLGATRAVVQVRVAPVLRDLVLVLIEDRTRAHQVEEVRRDFVVNVSHALKTPVGAPRSSGPAGRIGWRCWPRPSRTPPTTPGRSSASPGG